MTPRLVAPVRTLTETYQVLDTKYGRPAGAYATVGEARAARGPNRRRYQINTVPGPRFRAGPCSWCGWTSTLHAVKAAAVDAARHHRDQHTLEVTSPR
jgi:hypothetical protein